ncbi:MAG: metallophosphoesterase [Clostridium fessum]
MKQLRQMSILVRGHSFCCWSSHFFWLYGWCRMQGKSMHPGRKLQRLRQMAAMWRRMKNGAAGNLKDDESSAGEVIQDDADENASDGETALKRRTSRKQLYKRKKEPQKAQEETVYMPPTIWLATDLHYQSPQMTDFQSAFDTYTMGNDGTIVPYLDEITEAFLEEVRTAHPSALVLSGDLSQNGEKANHEALAEKLERVQAAGIPVLVIPGNHDINHPWAATYFDDQVSPAEGTSSEEFYQIYHKFGYDQAVSRASDSLSYVYRLDEKYWLMMLDSCICEPVHETGGKLSEETVAWMKMQLEEAKKQGVTVIPVSHHNLLDESTLYPEECTIENTKEVTALLETYGVPVYLSGHLHLQRIKKHTSNLNTPGGYGIREIVTSPLPMAPCQYSILNWQADGSLSYHTKKVDIAGWAQRYGEEDENLLNFDAYADQFLVDVISEQAFKALQSASKDIKEEMARLYADMNRDYCSGTKIDVAKIRKARHISTGSVTAAMISGWQGAGDPARCPDGQHGAGTESGRGFPAAGETIENPENAENEETAGADAGSPAEEIQKKEESYGLRGNCIQTAE